MKNDTGVWTCVCAEGFELNEDGECVEPDLDPVPDPDPIPDPDPDPQPDPEPDPEPEPEPGPKSCSTAIEDRLDEEYIPLSECGERRRELQVYDQRLINNGVTGPQYAFAHCPEGSRKSVFPWKGMSEEEVRAVVPVAYAAKVGLTGADGESAFYQNVCRQHASRPRGLSRAYRPCYDQRFNEARELTDGCAERGEDGTCERFHPQSRPRGIVSRLDGIKGACRAEQ